MDEGGGCKGGWRDRTRSQDRDNEGDWLLVEVAGTMYVCASRMTDIVLMICLQAIASDKDDTRNTGHQ